MLQQLSKLAQEEPFVTRSGAVRNPVGTPTVPTKVVSVANAVMVP